MVNTGFSLNLLISINKNSPPDKIPGFAISILEAIQSKDAYIESKIKLPLEMLLAEQWLDIAKIGMFLHNQKIYTSNGLRWNSERSSFDIDIMGTQEAGTIL